MDFLTVRELRLSSKNVWNRLAKNEKLVITNNGKPTALLLDIRGNDLEETLLSLQHAKDMRLFNRMRATAERRGFLSEKEIGDEIQAARASMGRKRKTIP